MLILYKNFSHSQGAFIIKVLTYDPEKNEPIKSHNMTLTISKNRYIGLEIDFNCTFHVIYTHLKDDWQYSSPKQQKCDHYSQSPSQIKNLLEILTKDFITEIGSEITS